MALNGYTAASLRQRRGGVNRGLNARELPGPGSRTEHSVRPVVRLELRFGVRAPNGGSRVRKSLHDMRPPIRLKSRLTRRSGHAGPGWGPGGLLLLALWLSAAPLAAAAARPSAPQDFTAPLDPLFTNALATLLQSDGLRQSESTDVNSGWRTNQCLILGIRVDEKAKHLVRLVELCTLAPGAANPAPGGSFDFPSLLSTGVVHHLKSAAYPMRLRLFDERGKFLIEDRPQVLFEFLTNGVAAGPLLMKQATDFAAALAANPTNRSRTATAPLWATNAELKKSLLAGEEVLTRSVVALVTLFTDTLSSEALKEVRQHAQSVVQMPNWFQVVTHLGFQLNLVPKFEGAALLPGRAATVWFPVELLQGTRTLVASEFVAGPTGGARFLTGGVQAIRVVHPTKPEYRLLIQVLAAGELPAR